MLDGVLFIPWAPLCSVCLVLLGERSGEAGDTSEYDVILVVRCLS